MSIAALPSLKTIWPFTKSVTDLWTLKRTEEEKLCPPETNYDSLPVGGDPPEEILRVSIEDLNSSANAEKIVAALKRNNFVIVSLPESKADVVRAAYEEARTFFLSSETEKRACAERLVGSHNDGYVVIHFDNQGSKRDPEQREVFSIHSGTEEGTPWPSDEFRSRVLASRDLCDDVARKALRAIAWGLGLPTDELVEIAKAPSDANPKRSVGVHDPASNFTLFRYADNGYTYNRTQRCMAHEDSGLVTVLPRTNAAALEVLNHDTMTWASIEAVMGPNDVVVYVGKACEKLCGGEVHAATHRIVREPGGIRYSTPYEVKPHPEQLIAPKVSGKSSPRWNHVEVALVHGAVCDLCEEQIVGVRHKCQDCADFDLCSECRHKDTSALFSDHTNSHTFQDMTTWTYQTEPVRADSFYRDLNHHRSLYRLWRLRTAGFIE